MLGIHVSAKRFSLGAYGTRLFGNGKQVRRRIVALGLLLCIFISLGPVYGLSQVVLHPGYITGTLSVDGESVTGGSVRAWDTTGQYTSDDSFVPNGQYIVTVEGGYTYNVVACAYMGNNSLYLGRQVTSVAIGETKTLDFYVKPGYINGSITVTRGTLGSYRLIAYYYDSGTKQGYTAYSEYAKGSDGTFNFPMIPGTDIIIYGDARVDDVEYHLEQRKISVQVGETTTVNYTLEAGMATIYGYISVSGQRVNYAYVQAYSSGKSAATYTTTDYYSLKVVPGEWTLYYQIAMNGSVNWMSLWGRKITISEGEALAVNFTVEPAYITGNIKLSGADTRLQYGSVDASSPAGQQASARIQLASMNYRLVVPTGDFRFSNLLQFDYPEDPDPYLYSYTRVCNASSPATTVAQGETANVDFEYSTATVITYFYVEEEGRTLSSPELYGIGIESGIVAQVWGHGSPKETLKGEVRVTLLPQNSMRYNFDAWAKVAGSRTKFGKFAVTVSPGDVIERDIGAPTLTVTKPIGGEILTSPTAVVEGIATDDTGVANVTVNGNLVTLTSTGNPNDLNEVSFSTTVTLQPGENTIRVMATDIYGKTTSLTRTLYREQDISAPTLMVTKPVGEEVLTTSTAVVEGIVTDDTGVANVTVNGKLVTLTSTGNPNDPKEVSFTTTIALALGENTIRVVATDIYGKTTSLVKTLHRILPKVSANVDIDPDTLNLKSKGQWITAYIELPEGYDVKDIDTSTIMLNDTVHAEPRPVAIGDYDNDKIPDLMVKFVRAEVISYILENTDIEQGFKTVTLTITGKLYNGTPFQGSVTIKITT